MTLTAGTRLGPYEILSTLGVGGMGEVYRARDAKLNRDVAIKVLLPAVANDPDRLARFSREAQVLASLNHPNIAHIHGIEESSGVTALVMEIVDGEDLSQRIARGAIPLDEALPIARQIAEALEAAHDQGIIHRDLKPANIKVRADGTVKVLDFGLAKASDPAGASSANAMNSPTLSIRATEAGLILGTAAYMSPEQAAGKSVDKRSDLWAFGVVLLEMLTGRQVFDGETVSHVLAAVLTKEPDWGTLPANTPAPIRRLLRRCLEKDRKRRLESAADARLEIDDAITAPAADAVGAANKGRPHLWRALAAVAGVAAAGLAVLYLRQPAAPKPEMVRFEIPEPEGTTFGPLIRLSPDGRMVMFLATGGGESRTRLWVRRLDSLESRPLPGTEGATGSFWSPDSRLLIFSAAGKLRKIDVAGGPAQSICDFRSTVGGGFFTADNKIVFGTPATAGIQQCPSGGGTATSITAFKPGGQEAWHAFPVLLPDQKHFLFWRSAGPESGIYAGSLDTKPEEQTGTRVLPDSSAPVYVPARDGGPGTVLFVREGTLMAQTFDAGKLVVTGEAVPVAENVLNSYSMSATSNGTLAYLTGVDPMVQVTWFDREGKMLNKVGVPGRPFFSTRLSPDGSRLAASRSDPGGAADVWIVDVGRASEERLTTNPDSDGSPIWSPDGDQIVFTSDREGVNNLYLRSANGAGSDELLFKSAERKIPTDWSRNGFLMFTSFTPNGSDLWILAMEAGSARERKAVPYLRSEFNARAGRFSPDGKFVAYQSDASGGMEVYVRPFDAAAPEASQTAAVKVSQGGGTTPQWRTDGKELFYLAPGRKEMAVDTTLTPAFLAGTPRLLFPRPENATNLGIAGDGQRFLLGIPIGTNKPSAAVVLNWQVGLRK